MNKAIIYGVSALGILVLIDCGGTDSPSTSAGGTGGAGGTSVTSTGVGSTGNAGSTAAGGTTSSGFGGFAPITGGAPNTGGSAGTVGLGGAPGGFLPDAGVGIIGAFDAGIGNFNFDAAGFTFDAAAFRFDGAVACPANQPNSGGICISADQACSYGSVTCTCAPPNGGLPINRWSCQ